MHLAIWYKTNDIISLILFIILLIILIILELVIPKEHTENKMFINGLDYISFNILHHYDEQFDNLLKELKDISLLNINGEL